MEPVQGGCFTVLIGPDGAGKTSLMTRMKTRAPEWRFTSLQPDDLYPIEHLECYDWALRTHPREYVAHMAPMTRASYFLHIIAIEWEYHILPALNEGRVVVCDSYWYRMAVKESIQNPSAAAILSRLTARLPVPDLVLWLDLPLAEAWRRNGAPTVFEVAEGELTEEAFTAFQRNVLDRVRAQVASIPQVTLDATAGPDQLADAALDQIRYAALVRTGAETAPAPLSRRR